MKHKSRNPMAIVARMIKPKREKSKKEKINRESKKLAAGYIKAAKEKDCVE